MSGDPSKPKGPENSDPSGAEQRPFLHPRSPRQAILAEQMPPPPSRRARHPLVVAGNAIFTGLFLLILAAGAGLYIGLLKFEAPGPLEHERTVVIPRGQGIREIAEVLRREGVINNPLLFVGGAMVLRATNELKAGEYLFERHASLRDVMETIIEGRSIQHQVTIPEGLTSEQIIQKINEADLLTGLVREIPREGTLLPETYKVTRGTTREQLVARMAASHRRLVNEVWERRAADLPLKSPEQLITLAAIVEKETGKADERPRVAAVFINRLNRRMKLQSDPTIIYGLVGGKGTLGRPLQREDVDRPTPYNTYIIDGLPPGPIANPGRASLEAVANPSRTKEIYFVADGSGGHIFAETYDQHMKNVANWREHQKEQAAAAKQESAPAAAPAPAAPASAPPSPPNAAPSSNGNASGAAKNQPAKAQKAAKSPAKGPSTKQSPAAADKSGQQ
ncbi:MAG: endolytic transglycosylase MltG [Xanthobacteraceae bacterium]|nr:endolytic transglycosylase MltG [Xanthobacteraceae bacterium]